MNKKARAFFLSLSAGLLFSASLAQAQESTAAQFSFVRLSLKEIFSGQHADYFYAGGDKGRQMSDAFEKPLSMTTLGDGIFFISGCRIQNCVEMGSAVVDLSKSKTLALAIRHYRCRTERSPDGKREETCDPAPTIDVFWFPDEIPGKRDIHSKIGAAFSAWEEQTGYERKKTHRCQLHQNMAVCN